MANGSRPPRSRTSRPAPAEAATGSASAGVCIVRVEGQGQAGWLITVTRYPDITAAFVRPVTRRTVDIEVAVAEVRSFLSEFRPRG